MEHLIVKTTPQLIAQLSFLTGMLDRALIVNPQNVPVIREQREFTINLLECRGASY